MDSALEFPASVLLLNGCPSNCPDSHSDAQRNGRPGPGDQLINYRKVAFSGRAVFYLVLELPSDADAGLGGIELSQIR